MNRKCSIRLWTAGVWFIFGAVQGWVWASEKVTFTTDEGTWINVDLSRDGRMLVFDLLGDLYTLPIEGGQARRLTSGRGFDNQPRWSPDGSWIAFCSDVSGSDNLWIVSASGGEPVAVTKEPEGGITAPAWTPDGRYLVVRKDPTYNRRGSAELWLYHREGGSGVRLTRRDAQGGFNPNGPVVSSDGRFVYFTHGNRSLDATWTAWQIWRLDQTTGLLEQITLGHHGALQPALSPDGKSLAYVGRDGNTSALFLRDLDTGSQRIVARGLDRDDQRGTTDYGPYPTFSFTPEGSAVIMAVGGKLQRINVSDGSRREIPFRAEVDLELPDQPYFKSRVDDDSQMTVRLIRWPTFTPDGRTLVFEALGKLWVQGDGGGPRRLTQDSHREYAPAISPDGRWIAYVSWDDQEGGHLWKTPTTGGNPIRLTQTARQYSNPAWSWDGSRIAMSWRAPHWPLLFEEDQGHEIVWIPAEGGPTHRVTTVRPRMVSWFPTPRFTAEGDRITFVEASSSDRNDLVSVRLDGRDKRSLARFRYLEDAALSPQGDRVAFVSMEELYVSELPEEGMLPLEVDLNRPALPLKKLSELGAGYPSWGADGNTVTWGFASTAYRQPLSSDRPEVRQVELHAPRRQGSGNQFLRGARLITLKGDEVIEQGDIWINGDRIAGIGPSGSLHPPAGTTEIDVSGKTIIPGLVDTHYHAHYAGREIFYQNKWEYLADLAYGVTTGRELSSPTRDLIAQSDMVEAGELIGPRLYGAGWPLFGAWEGGPGHAVSIKNLEDARRHVRRLKASGATYLKHYLQPKREQRQWVQQAALEEGVMLTSEGGGLKVMETLMLDRFTGFEHAIPVAPVYNDLIQLMVHSGIYYTPTFVAGYAKPTSMEYFYQQYDLRQDAGLRRFVPADILNSVSSLRVLIPDDLYYFKQAAAVAYQLVQAGGHIANGGHGNFPGIGPHWEIWSFVEGGMPPLEALRTSSLRGAELLGLDQDLGSLETGKIADFVILNSNPLQDIKRTRDIHGVVKAGQVFDPDELAARMPDVNP